MTVPTRFKKELGRMGRYGKDSQSAVTVNGFKVEFDDPGLLHTDGTICITLSRYRNLNKSDTEQGGHTSQRFEVG